MTTPITPIDPPGMFTSPAFAQGMVVPAGPLVFVGGQNGIDADGTLVDGLGPQTRLALRNLKAVLAEAGTSPEHVAKLTIFLTVGVDANEAYAASAAEWPVRTAVTVVAVPMSRPGVLVEIEAVAAIPAPDPA
ncbi:RidA family protein [Homoserinibacter sp. GY 40078]|uniref:RidA family protein n=1 Tax=Homoserinibacter sp. GY 40078 TaxID=2603275 RepID=UPI0011CBC9CB|nr:RidA family protein [Homoserinibacter sp. GY 40078]TXK18791.1 RidA family protein [Homoserinibacter sp. GY 40078]